MSIKSVADLLELVNKHGLEIDRALREQSGRNRAFADQIQGMTDPAVEPARRIFVEIADWYLDLAVRLQHVLDAIGEDDIETIRGWVGPSTETVPD